MRFFPPIGEQPGKHEQVEAMFSAIAPRYDLLNRLLSLGIDRAWRRIAVSALRATPGAHILDAATGTGDLALTALQNSAVTVTGVDLSEAMLKVARHKAAERGVGDRVTFQVADVEALPFDDEAFTGAMVAFGVRNFQNLRRGLEEMLRVLQPGAQLVVLEFSRPTSRLLRSLFHAYARVVLPAIGRAVSRVPGAYTYLPESMRAFPSGAAFLARMQEAGFANLRAQPLTFGVVSLYVGQAPTKPEPEPGAATDGT